MRNILALLALPTVLVAGSAYAGNVRGPQSTVDGVDPHGTDVYTMVFEAEQKAQVVVSGDGSTDLDCYVYDGNGNLLKSDTDSTDTCVLTWIPKWEGKFQVKIRNHGDIINIYRISTN